MEKYPLPIGNVCLFVKRKKTGKTTKAVYLGTFPWKFGRHAVLSINQYGAPCIYRFSTFSLSNFRGEKLIMADNSAYYPIKSKADKEYAFFLLKRKGLLNLLHPVYAAEFARSKTSKTLESGLNT